MRGECVMPNREALYKDTQINPSKPQYNSEKCPGSPVPPIRRTVIPGLHFREFFPLQFYSSAMPMRSNFSVEITTSKLSFLGFGVLTRMLRSLSS